MIDLRKAAEMALEVLENPWKAKPDDVADAIEALRRALEESANSTTNFVEPKAPSWAEQKQGAIVYRTGYESGYMDASVALNREWVGLTVEEVLELLPSSEWKADVTLIFAKAIEAKLKEKNA